MKYKVGDKVRVREDLEVGKYYGEYCFISLMAEQMGKVVEIEYVYSDSYSIKKDGNYWTEEMFSGLAEEPRNLMPLIAKELGVEIGERFAIGPPDIRFYFDDNSLRSESFDGKENDFNYDDIFVNLINGKTLLSKLPPKLTELERVILENLPKEYKHIARSKYGLYVYDDDDDTGTVFEYLNMFSHLFQFIKEDKELYNIEELLKG